MSADFETLVWFSQSYGLIYLLALALGVVFYAYWPSNRERFNGAATSILRDEDGP